jgi:hypothetical protein
MCTVTIVPQGKNNFILTSNRDEVPNRVSIPPNFYSIDGVKTLFPKDVQSDGTWIGVSAQDRLICVLNGGFCRHERKSHYKKSRGIVAKDFMVCDDIENLVSDYDFIDIEPFTMVIVDWQNDLKFLELVWNGSQAHFTELPLAPKIWSSSTLYSDAMKQERLDWFDTFKGTNVLNAKTLLEFHKTAGRDNDDYGVVMNRGFVKTTSITQVEKSAEALTMHYENLQDEAMTKTDFNQLNVVNE